ncbi:MAG TPA: helix-turn-helix transcriptional regulator [Blastocatellia bacterium]|nr:helix-turn-helix transcriptional regulator [Blastocatellia bacterium]
MRPLKQKRLEAKGWRVTSAEEFLGLTREEVALVEMKQALADAVKAQREKSHLSQAELAARMKSSQSRVAKIEAGDPSVSLDLLVWTVLSAGATKKEVAEALAGTSRQSIARGE